jgi:hypothetical protein
MNNRQNSCTRCLIVRNYLAQIEDDQIRMMCFLWSKGYSDDTVKRQLKLSWPRLRELKAQIATELLDAGIELRG